MSGEAVASSASETVATIAAQEPKLWPHIGFDSDDRHPVLDLFSGPGGWCVAAKRLGLNPLGIEKDDAACATRRAAGLATVQYDVSHYLDERYYMHHPLGGLIASPPCQTFSMAGKGAGRDALDQVLRGVQAVAMGEPIDYAHYEDDRTGLVLEPLRYALELGPEWMAWEQVPTVQPVWNACAEVLRAVGYSVWTGHLHAEQYGVPQTRKRSVLLASRTRIMRQPEPTHSRFYNRSPGKLDMGVEKWVSMAEALGWDQGVVGFPRRADSGASVEIDGVAYRERDLRDVDLPAQVVTEKVRSWQRWQLRNNTSANAAVRDQDEPAPTLYFGARMNGVYWQFAGAGATSEQTAGQVPRDLDLPAHTITGKGTAAWVQARNSGPGAARTPRSVEDPSYTIRANGSGSHPSGVEWQRNGQSVRVTVQEAAVLQSFPVDYPWQGSKTKQYQQVGNAIPPGLALHALATATGLVVPATQEGEAVA